MDRKTFLTGLIATGAGSLLPRAANADLGDDAQYTAEEITNTGASFFLTSASAGLPD